MSFATEILCTILDTKHEQIDPNKVINEKFQNQTEEEHTDPLNLLNNFQDFFAEILERLNCFFVEF